MSPRGIFTHVEIILHILDCLGQDMQVLYLGRAPRTKETLPDFLKWRRVTRPSLVFRGLTGSQRTPGFWGVTKTHGHLWSISYKLGLFLQSKNGASGLSTGSPLFLHRFLLEEPNSIPIFGLLLTKT